MQKILEEDKSTIEKKLPVCLQSIKRQNNTAKPLKSKKRKYEYCNAKKKEVEKLLC